MAEVLVQGLVALCLLPTFMWMILEGWEEAGVPFRVLCDGGVRLSTGH